MRNRNWFRKLRKPGYFLLLLFFVPLINLAVKSGTEKDGLAGIRTVMTRYDSLVSTITVIGTAIPKIKMNLTPELSGIVDEVFVDEGEIVEKGQQLLKINSSLQEEKCLLIRQEVIKTQSEVEQLQKDLERLTALYQLDQIAKKELDESNQKLNNLQKLLIVNQQLLALHQAKMEKAIIRAPRSGMILFAWPIEKGAPINLGQPLLSIISIDGVNIEAYLNQDDALKVEVGQKVFIKKHLANANHSDSLWQGALNFISPEIMRGMVKTILYPNENIWMKLGSSIEVSFPVHSSHRALVVPIEAVRIFDGKTYLVTLENDVIKKRRIVIGNNNHEFVEIISGDHIVAGSAIIVSHFDKIREGMKLKIQEDR